jgi:hypothetical protein
MILIFPPLVELAEICKEGRKKHIVRGITCSLCRLLIKSPTFYQCKEGCKASCFYESLSEDASSPTFYTVEENITQDEANSKQYPAYRLCSGCMSTTNTETLDRCNRSHLHEVIYSQSDINSKSWAIN